MTGAEPTSTAHYCTSFNEGYLIRGIALYQSLERHCSQPFTLWVLCFDERSFEIIGKLDQPNLKPVSISTLEAFDESLLAAKGNRSTYEYFFTCSPILPLYLLEEVPEVDRITYLDSDLFFHEAPTPIFDEMGSASILIIPHRFPENQKELEIHGIYNVGLISFKNDEHGLSCLRWWRERCLEWCYDRVEDGKFADQKYLDDWPTRFSQVHVLKHVGANLAPWNVANYDINLRSGKLYVDDSPLIFYHYQGVRVINSFLYDPGLSIYGVNDRKVKRLLYPGYFQALENAKQWVKQVAPDVRARDSVPGSRSYSLRILIGRMRRGYVMLHILK